MEEPVQVDLWQEEVANPTPEMAGALKLRAAKKKAVEEFGDAEKEAKNQVRALAKEMELPGGDGQLIIHAAGTRWACDLKSHTRVSIKELPEED